MFRFVLFCCFLHTPAWADLTIRGTHYPGISGGLDHQVTYLRNNQMRVDQLATPLPADESDAGISSSMLIRFSGHPSGWLFLDHESRRVQILSSLREINSENNGTQPSSTGTVNVVKQDETREILGQTAQRYDFSFSGDVDPLAIFGEQLPSGMAGSIILKLRVAGSSWVVPGMEGAGEVAAFFEKLSSRQITLGMLGQTPEQTTHELSFLSPGLSSSLTDVFRQITAIGFPLLTQTKSEMNVDMTGMMAGVIQGMLDSMGISGPQSTETKVTGVQTGKLAPELFYEGRLPQGYSLNTP